MPAGAPVNNSEAFVLAISQRTALTLWCYNNPKGKSGKELCDVLIVFGPHVIVISVKEIKLGTTDPAIDHPRWQRKAIDASIDQIYGAERWLSTATHVVRSDGSQGLALPPITKRKIHRIAVACGGGGEVVIKSADHGKGFTHVMTEKSFLEVLTELDTINDFVDYIQAKEDLLTNTTVIIEGSEANLLGLYLQSNRTFPTEFNILDVDNTIWEGLKQNPQFQLRKKADEESYTWDKLIDALSDPNVKLLSGANPDLSNLELAMRILASENRLSRRGLGPAVREFIELGKAKTLKSRVLTSGTTGTIYVLVYFPTTQDPKHRTAELGIRCILGRFKVGRGDHIVGIGLSDHIPGQGSMSDLIYIHHPNWTAEDDAKAIQMQADLGYFSNAIVQTRHEDEYPKT